jgi:D,D-heptose 1,7-bisphosphate phosphatase
MRICFLDRDGVLIKDVNYLSKIKDISFVKGIFQGLKKIINLKYRIYIVTNQSAVGRGIVSEKKLLKIHKFLTLKLKKHKIKISGIKYCPCHPNANIIKYKKKCLMRKPNPGMINEILKDNKTNPGNCFLIGDKKTDILAGKRAGIKKNFLYNNKQNFENFINNLINKNVI